MNSTPNNPDAEFMKAFKDAFDQAGGNPDVGFSFVENPSAADADELIARARELSQQIAHELAATAPAGWERVDAVFAWTVAMKSWHVAYSAGTNAVRVEPSEAVLELVQQQREIAAQMPEGPWWRMGLSLTNEGVVETEYDYGDVPFPEGQLFPPESYAADLAQYPRPSLPVWLAAYIGHNGRLTRSPRVAAEQVRFDREHNVRPRPGGDAFPPLPLLWARWATVAAAMVALQVERGPRILPSLAWFENRNLSGSTLYLLPGDRALISGGVWNAPALDAAYNGGAPLPSLYAGAPDWVTDAILNPRAGTGQLSFCYWWDQQAWFRGESPDGPALTETVPGVWTTETTVGVITAAMETANGHPPSEDTITTVETLVLATEAGVVTWETLAAVFTPETHDIDGALNQLTLAGLRADVVAPPLNRIDAIDQVRRHIQLQGTDTTGYPLDKLTASRIDNGWMVYCPTEPGQIMIGRAIYYIADDGIVETASSSVAPTVYAAGFSQRYQERTRR
ncbi:hypothetical protein ACTWPB_04265 [Nocardia sp. IBHARD005]|uniref:hypothetical protein n=1 Tax=Nocardia sp. IBHARD005 TaxID=3457765 RepID=UPI00405837F2